MSEVALSSDFLGCFGVLERSGATLFARNERELAPGAAREAVFDLPGGRVEPGETLAACLVREWREECCVDVEVGDFLFVQEGVRRHGGRRLHAWRSFFFRVTADGEPRPGAEVFELAWLAPARFGDALRAPYHAGFLRWLEDRRPFQYDEWVTD